MIEFRPVANEIISIPNRPAFYDAGFGPYVLPPSGATPALNLDFTTGLLDPRITFSRPSNATFYDSTGKLTYAPNNLLTYSEQFDNAAWFKLNASITANSTTSPDGTLSADTLIPNTSSADHSVIGIVGTVSSEIAYTQSVFAKAAGYSWIRMAFGDAAGGGFAFFNVLNGVVGLVSGGVSNIVSVGDGWFRCSFTRTTTAAGTLSSDIYAQSANNQFGWAGNGTSGIYLWGAQLEAVTYQTTPRTYNATTAAAYYGPRFDYDPVTLAANGLLIEEARTNAMFKSIVNTTTDNISSTVTINAGVGPDGLTKFAQFLETNTTAGHGAYMSGAPATTVAGTAYTGSIYLKGIGRTAARFSITGPALANGVYAEFNLTGSGSIRTNATNIGTGVAIASSAAITYVGNDIYRVAVGLSNVEASSYLVINSLNDVGAYSFLGDVSKGLFYGYAQIEAGSFTTSYIPTASGGVARSADVATMTGANFSSWYNQSAGTFVANYYERAFSVAHQVITNYGPLGTDRISFNVGATNVLDVQVSVAGVDTFAGNTPTFTAGNHKIAFAYETNNAGVSADGSAVTDDNTVTLPTALSTLVFGAFDTPVRYLNSTIKSVSYYNTRLSNTQLQSLST